MRAFTKTLALSLAPLLGLALGSEENICDSMNAPTFPRGTVVEIVEFKVNFLDRLGRTVEGVSYIDGESAFSTSVEYKIRALHNGREVGVPAGRAFLGVRAMNSRGHEGEFYVLQRGNLGPSERVLFAPPTPLARDSEGTDSPSRLTFAPFHEGGAYISPALYKVVVRGNFYWFDDTGRCHEAYLNRENPIFVFTPAIADPMKIGKLLIRNQMVFGFIPSLTDIISPDPPKGKQRYKVLGILPGVKLPARIGEPLSRENAFGYTLHCLNSGWMSPHRHGIPDIRPVYGSAGVTIIRSFPKQGIEKEQPGSIEARNLAQLTYKGFIKIGATNIYEEFLTRVIDSYKPYGFLLVTTPTRTYILASKSGYFDDLHILLLELPFSIEPLKDHIFSDTILNQMPLSKSKVEPRGDIPALWQFCDQLKN